MAAFSFDFGTLQTPQEAAEVEAMCREFDEQIAAMDYTPSQFTVVSMIGSNICDSTMWANGYKLVERDSAGNLLAEPTYEYDPPYVQRVLSKRWATDLEKENLEITANLNIVVRKN